MDADLIRRAPRDRCSVAHALAVLGERWTILVLREAFYGIRRFDEMQRAIGCARNVLADRLATLVEHGVLARVGYRDEGQRERFEYRLTPMGFEAFPVIVALMQWGDRWLPAPGARPSKWCTAGAAPRCTRSSVARRRTARSPPGTPSRAPWGRSPRRSARPRSPELRFSRARSWGSLDS